MTMPTISQSPALPPQSGSSNLDGLNLNPLVVNPFQGFLDKKRQDEVMAWVNEQYSKAKDARRSTERQWYLNLSYFFGRQNVSVVTTAASANGFRLYTPPAPPWRVRLVVNKVRPIVRRTLAKVTKARPRFTVIPATTEDEDLTAARVGEAIFDSVYREHDLKSVTKRVAWWGLICGTSFFKCYWDPNKTPVVSQKDPNGQPVKGDFCIEAVTPFHLYVPDLKADNIEDQAWLIHATLKSPEWVQLNFKVSPPTVKATDDILEDSFLNLVGAQANAAKELVLVLECWVKPGTTKILPNGGLITIAGDKVVQLVEQYPYEHNEFPFARFEDIPSGKFYGDSAIVDLLPLQKEYNRTRSQIIENKNRMSKLQLMAAKGSVDPNKITSEPGQVILYTMGFPPPTPLPLQNLPNFVIQEVQQLQQDLDDISGQHEISRGQNPSQVTAATALSYLQEQDDTMLSSAIESLESCVEKVGRCVLSYVSQFWSTDRLVKVVGQDGSFDAQVYKGASLNGNHDLKVEAGSALPTSKAAKQAFLMDLMKLGLIDPTTGLELLDLGGVEKAYENFLADTRQAQRENLKLAESVPVPVNDWDNHQVHIEYHNRFRKQQQFESLPADVKELYQAHVDMHKALLGMAEPPGLETPGVPGQDPGMMDPTGGAMPPTA